MGRWSGSGGIVYEDKKSRAMEKTGGIETGRGRKGRERVT